MYWEEYISFMLFFFFVIKSFLYKTIRSFIYTLGSFLIYNYFAFCFEARLNAYIAIERIKVNLCDDCSFQSLRSRLYRNPIIIDKDLTI